MSDKTFGFLMFAAIAGIIIAGASASVASYAGAIPAIIVFLLGLTVGAGICALVKRSKDKK